MAVEFLQSGMIGKITRIYSWSNKGWGDDAPAYTGEDPVPEGLDWDLWLGSAPARPFLTGKYHPGQWRKILDFGCGTLGDMGVHILDIPYTALRLGYPRSVKVNCREPNHFSHPTKNIVDFEFPGTAYTAGPLKLTWFDGGYAPVSVPQENPDLQLEDGKALPRQGSMFIGEDGKRMLVPHGSGPQPLPRKLLANIEKPVLKPANHYHEWVDASVGKGTCSADFEYAAYLTTGILMGVLGNRFPGKTLEWNFEKKRFYKNRAANKRLSRNYRKGF